MKKAYLILVGIFSLALFNACDVIEEPYVEEGNLVWNGRKSILLDFTGHTCGNCPEGHHAIDNILSNYHEAVIPIAIHCGWYSRIEGDTPDEPFGYDFTTDIGFELGGDGVSSGGALGIQGQPTGLINMLDGLELKAHTAWAGEVANFISSYPKYSIDIEAEYSEDDSTISCDINIESITDVQTNLNLAVYIVESNIIMWQRDYAAHPEDVEDYEHNHVLRGGFNGTWGEDIGEVESVSKSYQMDIGADWVPANCIIVAFVYDNETMDILQAEEQNFID